MEDSKPVDHVESDRIRIKRAQSAMEYLMTYGWAILIIAVVLAALFSLGVFSQGSTANGCIPTPGFLCQNLVFNANTNANPSFLGDVPITVNFGTTIAGWSNVYLAVVPAGQTLNSTSIVPSDEAKLNDFFHWAGLCGGTNPAPAIQGQLSNFKQVQVTMYINLACAPISISNPKIGTHFSGTIWAMYSIPPTVTNALVQVAAFGVTASQN